MTVSCAELLLKTVSRFAVLLFYYNIGISSTLFSKGEKKRRHNLPIK